MKRSIALYVAAALLGLGALAPAALSNQEGGDSSVDQLRQELDAAQESIDALTAELAETRQRLDATIDYLERQQRAAGQMADVLSAAEAAGFTAGINYKSREILLDGWRAKLAVARAELPAGPPAPEPAEDSRPPQ